MDQPSWMTAAWGELGVRERAGAADEPQVVSYFREAGHARITEDETPWCAAFAGAMLARANVPGTGSLLARSYLAWGDQIDAPRFGALCVLSRGSDPGAGHVGFYIGETDEKIVLLGGNQADAVTVAAFDADRLLGYRWPAPAATAAKVAPPKTTSVFERALAHVLEMEGGFTDDPHDPGGPTNRGVTLATYAKWRGVTVDATSRARLIDDLKRIDGDTVAAIYRNRYWRAASCAELDAALALMHFDAAVNHGVGGAIRLLQAASGARVDGEIGPETRAAIGRGSAPSVIAEYANLRRARYRALPHFWRFGRGWLNRVDATERLAMAWLENGATSSTTQTKTGDSDMATGQRNETDAGKWWAQSKTVWGAIITAAATVIPAFGPLIGVDLPADVIRDAGEQTVTTVQAVVGLIGTLLTIYGRLTAAGPLTRRPVSLKL